MKTIVTLTLALLSLSTLSISIKGRPPGIIGPHMPRTLDSEDFRLNDLNPDFFLVCTQDGCIDYSDPDNDDVSPDDPPKDEPEADDPKADGRIGKLRHLLADTSRISKWIGAQEREVRYQVMSNGERFQVLETPNEYRIHERNAHYFRNLKALSCSTYEKESFIIDKDCLSK